MRQTIMVASIISVVALAAAVWGPSIIGHGPDMAKAGAASSVNPMQIMKKANGLPEENWPAH